MCKYLSHFHLEQLWHTNSPIFIEQITKNDKKIDGYDVCLFNSFHHLHTTNNFFPTNKTINI